MTKSISPNILRNLIISEISGKWKIDDKEYKR